MRKLLFVIIILLSSIKGRILLKNKNWHNLKPFFEFSEFKKNSKSYGIDEKVINFVINNVFEVVKDYIFLTFKVFEEQVIDLSNINSNGPIGSLKKKFGDKLYNYDFLWKVNTIINGGGIIANASANIFHSVTKRPNIGLININLFYLKNIKNINNEFINYFFTILHETFHSLGFNNNSISKMKDKIIYNRKNLNFIVKTPTVLKYARKNFGCSSLDHLNFENNYTPHWELIQFGNDTELSARKRNSKISEITLAFFEDLGYYKMNYNMSEYLPWGLKKGCDFINKPSNKFEEFGKSNQYLTCSDDNLSKAYYERSSNSNGFRIKNNGTICNYKNVNSCINFITISNYELSYCVKTKCINNGNKLNIIATMSGIDFICKNDNELYERENLRIKCPIINKFCDYRYECKNGCNGRGYCLNGDCICNKNYKGVACEFESKIENDYQLNKLCNFNGYFKENECICYDNYEGKKCENIIIDRGSYGSKCSKSIYIKCNTGEYYKFLNRKNIN